MRTVSSLVMSTVLCICTVSAHKVMSTAEAEQALSKFEALQAQKPSVTKASDPFFRDLFMPMDRLMPTPDTYRTADGTPGSQYWENRADYDLAVILDEDNDTLSGNVTITYHNFSPQPLPYLWLQLDQQGLQHDNAFFNGNIIQNHEPRRRNDAAGNAVMDVESLRRILKETPFGFTISSLTDASGQTLPFFIQGSMMRVTLQEPLLPNQSASISMTYHFKIPDRVSRTGFEQYPDGSKAFYIMQFYPRMAYFDQSEGWDVRQYLGSGEFNLPFGDFQLRITVPDNHVVGATGVLQNPEEVLDTLHLERYTRAQQSKETIDIVSKKEAETNRSSQSTGMKTWHFFAGNVRDVAFASSRRFVWESRNGSSGINENNPVQLHSFYHPENYIIPSLYGMEAMQHTLNVFSRHTFDYPYPVSTIVEGANLGMEYPMLATWNFKQQEDGTYDFNYSEDAVLILIHEVGHNFVPMVVSTNERKWGWMDEGLNTFLTALASSSWSKASDLLNYQQLDNAIEFTRDTDRPIMMDMPDNYGSGTYGFSAYSGPSLGLTLLRETVLGRTVFDRAFREFMNAWKFKHPTPYDFFRFMEKSSGRNLQWFWKGWFFSNGNVDMAIDDVKIFSLQQLTLDDKQNDFLDQLNDPDSAYNRFISTVRDRDKPKYLDNNLAEKDDYQSILSGERSLNPLIEQENTRRRQELGEENLRYLDIDKNFIQIKLSNLGGIVMPVIIQIDFEDGTSIKKTWSANIWRENKATKTDIVMMIPKKEVSQVRLDPNLQTADVSVANNFWSGSNRDKKEYIYLDKFDYPVLPNLLQKLNIIEREELSN